ncbi:autotransporter outer membrane beta-barrel domain-containing protein [Candidatus Paracaedibacter symbiosus]|uniref:autotransporter outer membrane beta-barrel domain-containing protein n=1 Tax=Candidatus Paracaedibacter symbiosus TaxID=244582 RepID=UPI00050971B8|nr:autotransporter outer membrane beta-barrel domain-containing protein [Candidatus Paracaedibacter symbiosus]
MIKKSIYPLLQSAFEKSNDHIKKHYVDRFISPLLLSTSLSLGLISSSCMAHGGTTGTQGSQTTSSTSTSTTTLGGFFNSDLDKSKNATIEDGIIAKDNDRYIGFNADYIGTVTVSELNSDLIDIELLNVGFEGRGVLTILGGGKVSSDRVFIGSKANSVGELNIGAASTDPNDAAPAGTLETNLVTFGEGNGTLNFNHPHSNYLFSAFIDGRGSVNIFSGKTIFTGTNTISGKTTIQNGALQIGNGGKKGRIGGEIINDSELIFNRSDNISCSHISGKGSLTKMGKGDLTLEGENTYSGITEVKQGQLNIEDTLKNSPIIVGPQGTLNASGVIKSLSSKGTTTIGNKIPTLNITEDACFGEDHIFICNVNAEGQADQLIVNGTVKLGGTLSLLMLDDNLDDNILTPQSYTILSSKQEITTQFASTTLKSEKLDHEIIYNTYEVLVKITNKQIYDHNFSTYSSKGSDENAEKTILSNHGKATSLEGESRNGGVSFPDILPDEESTEADTADQGAIVKDPATISMEVGQGNDVGSPAPGLQAEQSIETDTADQVGMVNNLQTITPSELGNRTEVLSPAPGLQAEQSIEEDRVDQVGMVNNLQTITPSELGNQTEVLSPAPGLQAEQSIEEDRVDQGAIVKDPATISMEVEQGNDVGSPAPGLQAVQSTEAGASDLEGVGNDSQNTPLKLGNRTEVLSPVPASQAEQSIEEDRVDQIGIVKDPATISMEVEQGNDVGSPPPGSQAGEILQQGEPVPALIINTAIEVSLPPQEDLPQSQLLFNVPIAEALAAAEMSYSSDIFFAHTSGRLTTDKANMTNLFVDLVNHTNASLKHEISQIFGKKTASSYLTNPFSPFPESKQLPPSFRLKLDKVTFWIQNDVRNFSHNNIANINEGSALGILANTYATNLGADYAFNPNLILGVITGYSYTNYKFNKGYGEGGINSYRFGFYGIWYPAKNWYVNAFTGYGYHILKDQKNSLIGVFNTSQKQCSHHVNATIEAGYDFKLADDYTFTPYAGIGSLYFYQQGKTTQEKGAINAKVLSSHAPFIQSKLGAQVSKMWMLKDTQAYGFIKLGYTYRKALNNNQNALPNFTGKQGNAIVSVNNKHRNLFNFGVGTTLLFKNAIYISVVYEGEVNIDQRSNKGLIRLGWKF